MKLFKHIAEKLNLREKKVINAAMTDSLSYESREKHNEFLKGLSKHALKLYEKQCDIKHFTKLALSDPENTDHNEIVAELFRKGIKDPLEQEKLSNLADNEKFLKDLGLIE